MLKKSLNVSSEPAEQLTSFFKNARELGMGYETIRTILLSAGWKNKEISNLFVEGLELPVPMSRQKSGAREAFFHLSAFTCLYVASVAFVMLLFSMIDLTIPDATESYWNEEWAYSTIRSTMSTVIVFFPIYLLFNWLIRRDTITGKMKAGGVVERWLTYLTLFVIVVTVLIDATSLLYWFLEGQMTIRLLFKAFVLFGVMCGVFLYMWKGTVRWSAKAKSQEVVGQE